MILSSFAILLGPGVTTALGATASHPIGQSGSRGEPGPVPTAAGFFSLFGPYEITMIVMAAGVLAAFFGRGWHRIPALARYPKAIHPLLGLGAFLAFMAMPIALGGFMIVLMRLDAEQVHAMSAIDQLQLEAILRTSSLFAVVAIVVGVQWVQSQLGAAAMQHLPPLDAPRPQRDAATLGVLTWLGSWPVITTVSAAAIMTLYIVTGSTPDQVAHDTLRLFEQARGSIWLPINIAVVVIVAPIMEELQYRYFLQRAFRSLRIRPWTAIIITSALFAGMHLMIAEAHAIPPLFALSLALGWSYEKSGRIITPILVHAGFNLANVAIFFLAMAGSSSAAPTGG